MRFGMALGWLLVAVGACGQVLPLPPRPADAFPGSVVGKAVTDLPLAERGAGFRSAKTTTFGCAPFDSSLVFGMATRSPSG